MKVNMEKIMRHPNAEYIIAFAEGKQLQFCHTALDEPEWFDFQGQHDVAPHIGPWNYAPKIKWRVKPEQQWVRVAMLKDASGEWEHVTNCEEEEKRIEDAMAFSYWISDRLYYTPKDKA